MKIVSLLLGGLLIWSPLVFPQNNVDYSKVDKHILDKYKYNPQELEYSSFKQSSNSVLPQFKEETYFTTSITNPISLSQSSGSIQLDKKYKNLSSNTATLSKCWDGAAKAYGLDPWLLMAVAKVESSFNNQAINKNKNNSIDIGMMQINTIWIPTLNKFGINTSDLLNPCTSIFVGAWIMAQNIKRFGYNADGIGAYNSPSNIPIRRSYASKVYKAYAEIVKDLYVKK